jgi:toxin ParE1/3/4
MLTRRPEAEQDLIDIYLHVSRDNPAAAEKLVRAIDAKCERLARNPMIGRARPELRLDLRSLRGSGRRDRGRAISSYCAGPAGR